MTPYPPTPLFHLPPPRRFEQKAVAVLLTLLHLGIKNIRLGPRLPAFLTPEALQVGGMAASASAGGGGLP